MAAPSNEHESRIRQFQTDLGHLNVRDFIRKHITTGNPVVIMPDDYYELRRLVAKNFDVHPSAVVVVGSCRMGFSIKPEKCYSPADSASDIDVAMISQEQFDYYWDGVFNYAHSDAAWKKSCRYKYFAKALFQGWIDPRGLPKVKTFSQSQQWVEFFDQLMQSRRFESRRISARLYRNWDRLEAYQDIAINLCRSKIERKET
jgi:hypothetical protein